MVRREREGVRWLATKPGRTELSALVATKRNGWGAGCTSER